MTSQMATTGFATVPTYYRSTNVNGLNIAYREAGEPGSPKLVLLHGFPASSHQYRDLIPALATRFHVIAPDYAGFGHSDMPDPATFAYTFDKLSEITEGFLKGTGFDRYGLFVQDYGGPVGFRILMRHPGALEVRSVSALGELDELLDRFRNRASVVAPPSVPLGRCASSSSVRYAHVHPRSVMKRILGSVAS